MIMAMEADNSFSLFQLNAFVKTAVKGCFPDRYWVHAELSEVRESTAGHCYVEFIEKEEHSGRLTARAKGNIWAATYRLVRPYFETSTGQAFVAGIKVLVQVSVEFHELYGYALVVHDIDPVYTLGDMVRRRQEIVRQLTEEGIIDMNKELSWPVLPQRIAVISSPTAAGYGDFLDQLHGNANGYRFYPVLFPAVMQGDQSEKSIIDALGRVFDRSDFFDVLVIIRGGGATSDLSCFDSYLLASHVAQFPLPVITGIGHERDDTVLDMVANKRVKTPTAAAEYVVSKVNGCDLYLQELQQEVVQVCRRRMDAEKLRINALSQWIPRYVQSRVETERSLLARISLQIPLQIEKKIGWQKERLSQWSGQLPRFLSKRLNTEKLKLQHIGEIVALTSPDTILKKGYTLTTDKSGCIVKSSKDVRQGEILMTRFADGNVESEVKKIKF